MNALVGVRNNASGQLSPSSSVRSQVTNKLAETADARAGLVTRETGTPLPTTSSASSSSGVAAASTVSSRATGGELDKDAFLRLLVLQMQNQDPLEPMENSDMLAQLAQFSALEGQDNLNSSFERLSGNVDQLNFISASQMLGKVVEGVNLNGELIRGKVDGVHLDGSVVVLTVDGQFMSMAGVVRVEPGSTAEAPVDPPPEPPVDPPEAPVDPPQKPSV